MRRSNRIKKKEFYEKKEKKLAIEDKEKVQEERKRIEQEELEILKSKQPKKKQKLTDDEGNNKIQAKDGDTDEEDNTEEKLGRRESQLLRTLSSNGTLFEKLNSFQKKNLSSTLTRALSDARKGQLPPIDLCEVASSSCFDNLQLSINIEEEDEEMDTEENDLLKLDDMPNEIIVDIFLNLDTRSRICLSQVNSRYLTMFQKWVGIDLLSVYKLENIVSVHYSEFVWNSRVVKPDIYLSLDFSLCAYKNCNHVQTLSERDKDALCVNIHLPFELSNQEIPPEKLQLNPIIFLGKRNNSNNAISKILFAEEWLFDPSLRAQNGIVIEWTFQEANKWFTCDFEMSMRKSFIHKTLREGKDFSNYARDSVLNLVYNSAVRCERLLNFNWNRPYHGNHFSRPPSFPQPVLLKIPLYPHQLQALHWMNNVEKLVREERKCEFSVLMKAEGFSFAVETWRVDRNNFTDPDREIIMNPDEVLDDDEFKETFTMKGGIFADEMGLGKTMTLLSLILSNPSVPFDHSKVIEKKTEDDIKIEEKEIPTNDSNIGDDDVDSLGLLNVNLTSKELSEIKVDEEIEECEEIMNSSEDEEWGSNRRKKKTRSKSPKNNRSRSPKGKEVDKKKDNASGNRDPKTKKRKLPTARKSHRSKSPKKEEVDDKEEESPEIIPKNTRKRGRSKKDSPLALDMKTEQHLPKKLDEKWVEEGDGKKHMRKVFISKATLVFCPGHIIAQWCEEFKRRSSFPLAIIAIRTIRNLRHETYRSLVDADVVIIPTSFIFSNKGYSALLLDDFQSVNETFLTPSPDQTPLIHHIHWHRIVLDEGHEATSVSRSQWLRIHSTYRWYVSGTPIPEGRSSLIPALDFLHFTILPSKQQCEEDIPDHHPNDNNIIVDNIDHNTIKDNNNDALGTDKRDNEARDTVDKVAAVETRDTTKVAGDSSSSVVNTKKTKQGNQDIEEDMMLLQLRRKREEGSVPYEIVLFQAVKKTNYWRSTKDSIRKLPNNEVNFNVALTNIKEELRVIQLTDLEKAIMKIGSKIVFPLRDKSVKEALTGSERDLNNPHFCTTFLAHYLNLIKKEELYMKRDEEIKKSIEKDLEYIQANVPENKDDYYKDPSYIVGDITKLGEQKHADTLLLKYLSIAAPIRSLVGDDFNVPDIVDLNWKIEDADQPSYLLDPSLPRHSYSTLYTRFRYITDDSLKLIFNRAYNRYGLHQAQIKDKNEKEELKKQKEENEKAWKEQYKREFEVIKNRARPTKYTKKMIDDYAEIGYKRVFGKCGTKMAEIAKYIFIQIFYSIYLPKAETGFAFDFAKILVFAKNLQRVKNVEIALQIFDPGYFDSSVVATIKGSSLATDKAVREYQKVKGEGTRVLLLSLENYASGTDLHNTTHILLVDSIECSSKENAQAYDGQAIARAHRIGQMNDVIVVRFIVENTYEQRYYEDIYGPLLSGHCSKLCMNE